MIKGEERLNIKCCCIMKYDIAIIGGGPAGIMAASLAASRGSRVVLIEKNSKLGLKLLITGKGRCNITNAEPDQRLFINNYGKNGKFLFSSFNQFSNQSVIDFFESSGLKIKVERGNRVFPVSDKSSDVLDVLKKSLKENKVEVMLNTEVKKFTNSNSQITNLITNNGVIVADKYILCTGGKSYPETGSTGDFYNWLKTVGHSIIEPKPALVPIVLKEKFIKDLEGLSLKNVEISVFQNNKKKDFRFGEALFTDRGLSGPIILDMSKKIGDLLASGAVELRIDFKPALEFKKLDIRLQKDFDENKNRMFKNALDKLLPQKLIPIVIKISEIDPNKKVHSISKNERHKLLHILKEFKLIVDKLTGFDKAIVTAGGCYFVRS